MITKTIENRRKGTSTKLPKGGKKFINFKTIGIIIKIVKQFYKELYFTDRKASADYLTPTVMNQRLENMFKI